MVIALVIGIPALITLPAKIEVAAELHAQLSPPVSQEANARQSPAARAT